MNSVFKAKKQILENTLSKVASVNVEITFARTNMITIAWDKEKEARLKDYKITSKENCLIMSTTRNVICLFVV